MTNKERIYKICQPLADHFNDRKKMGFVDHMNLVLSLISALDEAEQRGEESKLRVINKQAKALWFVKSYLNIRKKHDPNAATVLEKIERELK